MSQATDASETCFTVDATGGFWVIVGGEELDVYEAYSAAIRDIQAKLRTDENSFLAQVTIDADGGDDVAVALEQVSWQQVIRDLTAQETEV